MATTELLKKIEDLSGDYIRTQYNLFHYPCFSAFNDLLSDKFLLEFPKISSEDKAEIKGLIEYILQREIAPILDKTKKHYDFTEIIFFELPKLTKKFFSGKESIEINSTIFKFTLKIKRFGDVIGYKVHCENKKWKNHEFIEDITKDQFIHNFSLLAEFRHKNNCISLKNIFSTLTRNVSNVKWLDCKSFIKMIYDNYIEIKTEGDDTASNEYTYIGKYNSIKILARLINQSTFNHSDESSFPGNSLAWRRKNTTFKNGCLFFEENEYLSLEFTVTLPFGINAETIKTNVGITDLFEDMELLSMLLCAQLTFMSENGNI